MFNVDSRSVYGELTRSGVDSQVYLQDSKVFVVEPAKRHWIHGVLNDLTRVTLLECVVMTGLGSSWREGESYHFAKLFPHFVIEGREHLDPTERNVGAIHFQLTDAEALFYDFDAFGVVFSPGQDLIREVIKARKLDREVRIGEHPSLLYFAGKREIVEVRTRLGKLSVCHNPSLNMPGPSGVGFTNKISCTLEFPSPALFSEAVEAVLTLIMFFSIVAGRRQGLESTELTLASGVDESEPKILEVYWSYNPGRHQEGSREPHPAEVLSEPIHHPEAYRALVSRWLERHSAMRDARGRFSALFSERRYDVDRLIGLANVFDILPANSVPPDVRISANMQSAVNEATSTFKTFPESPEKQSVLNVLGRVGRSNLKRKIRHRNKMLTDAARGWFEDLDLVTDEAVNCRNHYVHGSSARIDYNDHPQLTMFFADTLEFVFAASDLIECGWNMNEWLSRGTVGSHPFGVHVAGYRPNVQELKTLLRE